ncbi:hypothetical protein SCLCIDRAFT_1218815 [Scleroderma citrinum Foug A]|uniref:protein-tyrosine-phosphatase n=1 Tax=Scleroderma citrinum Foug A TaxID=1036808 RepID=A0A0C3DPR0_9AGAM|nr:hypothetical protein SCLCIDRAFT_1218815 [Scleroderma citrinum Foug A]
MKRARPANLTLLPDTSRAFYPAIALDADDAPDSPPSPLTPSSSSSPSLILSPAPDFTLGVDADDLSRDLADLARLRKNVQRNLRLRPIRSFNALPNVSAHRDHACRSARQSSPSSSSATSSVYYTPVDPIPSSPLHSPPPSVLAASAWHPGLLADRLSSSKRPILIDTRPYATYQVSHLAGSVNIAIPSLILKRYRKPGGGFHSLDSLRQYVTSEEDKQQWDIQSAPGGDRWDGDIVIIHGEETDESDKDNLQVTAWALLPVLSVLLGPGRVHYLRGGMPAAQLHPRLSPHIVVQNILNTNVSEQPLKSAKGTGVFQINTAAPTTTTFPDVTAPEPSLFAYQLSDSPDEPTLSPSQPIHRPRSVPSRHPSAQNLWRAGDQPLTLPRLQIRTEPTCPATMPVTPTQSTTSMSPHISLPPQSPSHLTLLHSNHTPPAASPRWTSSPGEFLPPPPSVFTQSPYSLTPPRTPDTPMPNIPVRSPGTSRPFNMAPSSSGSDLSEELPTFSVSTILPGFLYLGPELSLPTHVTELKALGIRRILNIAAECDADDYGLALDHEFERYIRVPMRDTVEEEKVRDCLRLVCQILDEAALYNAGTYVHCKAGRSRSVAAVMAYLIHAHHWPLSRAYAFVVGRRRGVSPNIGFVSELMAFEARELGGRPGGTGIGADGEEQNSQGRRLLHARESLPPMLCSQEIEEEADVGLVIGQDMEIMDAEGRWRHVRRAPVDEATLQPMRRVSKAGLESTAGPSSNVPHSNNGIVAG